MRFTLKITECVGNRVINTVVHNATKDDMEEFAKKFDKLRCEKVSSERWVFCENDKEKGDWQAMIRVSAQLQ